MGLRRRLSVAAVTVLVPVLFGTSSALSLARLTDADASTNAIATDTLNPPTGLAATGGSSASLTWTPTTDTYATGYEVRR